MMILDTQGFTVTESRRLFKGLGLLGFMEAMLHAALLKNFIIQGLSYIARGSFSKQYCTRQESA